MRHISDHLFPSTAGLVGYTILFDPTVEKMKQALAVPEQFVISIYTQKAVPADVPVSNYLVVKDLTNVMLDKSVLLAYVMRLTDQLNSEPLIPSEKDCNFRYPVPPHQGDALLASVFPYDCNVMFTENDPPDTHMSVHTGLDFNILFLKHIGFLSAGLDPTVESQLADYCLSVVFSGQKEEQPTPDELISLQYLAKFDSALNYEHDVYPDKIDRTKEIHVLTFTFSHGKLIVNWTKQRGVKPQHRQFW